MDFPDSSSSVHRQAKRHNPAVSFIVFLFWQLIIKILWTTQQGGSKFIIHSGSANIKHLYFVNQPAAHHTGAGETRPRGPESERDAHVEIQQKSGTQISEQIWRENP